MKSYGTTTIFTIFSILFFMFVKFDSWTILAFVNAAAVTSLIFIIMGALLFVSGQGFFSGIAYSFRRFFKKTSKTWQMLDEPDEEYSVRKHSFSLTIPFLAVGIGLFLVTFFISLYVF